MPIANVQDAHEVDCGLQAILSAPDAEERARSIRTLFVETLDFKYAESLVPLNGADPNLPPDARLLARRDGFSALYIPLDDANSNRITGATASAAAKVIGSTVTGEPLLLFTNRDCDQLHFIYPDLSGAQPSLKRMVAHRNQPGRTVVQQIANLWRDYGESGLTMGEAVTRAFSVQPVTNAFFRDYKAAYDDAVQLIAAAGLRLADAEQFTQTLFNRLLFVHFVSRKGWLSFSRRTDYLDALWGDYQTDANAGNFYVSRLTNLFFAGLNNPQSLNLSSGVRSLIGNVPFLNGGLFEETDLDRLARNAVPDAAVAPLITGLFNRYNFTVLEATPLDTEVAVDPEMLGKLFEETVNERHSSGAYYTPRPVVAFMCREAIKGYLAGRNIGGLDDDKIADLVDRSDPQAVTVSQAREVANAVAGLKAVDPACGSGAFLLGMLQEIVALNETLFRAGHTPESLYRQKLDIITNNIYGVDKDGLAVSTAMLRLWLSLAVDYEGDGPPAPLPNLDLKLVVGDAIAGPNPQQLDLTLASIVSSGLERDIAAYTTAHGQQKSTLKQRVDATKAQLRSQMEGAAPPGIVEWRIDFADVMLNGGFDVVIANPPYVVVKDDRLRHLYKEGIYGRMNLYGLFIQRSLQLLAENGQMLFINPRTLLTDKYFTNLRNVITSQSQIKSVVLIADRHNTFDRVLQECIIIHLNRKACPATHYLMWTRSISVPSDLNSLQGMVQVSSEQVLLGDDFNKAFYISSRQRDYHIFETMLRTGVKLSEYGIATETGKIQFDKYTEYARPTDADGACRLIWAENIQRYAWRTSRKRTGKEFLSKAIMDSVSPNVTGTGIIMQRISANEQPRRIIATMVQSDNMSNYSENHTNFIPIKERPDAVFLLGALSSSLVEFIFRRLNSNTQVSAGEINSLPLPPSPDYALRIEIETLVDNLLDAGGVDCRPEIASAVIGWERRLDVLIGSLYGISSKGVEWAERQLASYETVYGVQI